MKHTGAEILIRLLERQGIEVIAGIPGGANLPIYDALSGSSIRHVLARHEQGAGFIAQGMARASGRAAVCMGTSGPGATNLLTAIADAKLDSIPLIAITGQVPTGMIGTDAFQEVDSYGMSIPITKHNFLVRQARDLLQVVPEAFRIATSGRPGPVLIDVPKDVQKQAYEFDAWPDPGQAAPALPPAQDALQEIAAALNRAQRPLFYVGGGVVSGGGTEQLLRLAEQASVPVTTTLMALGTFPPHHPLYLGMLGMHGGRATNLLLRETDLLVVVGARFDDRATGKVADFCPQAAVAHIDIDTAELGKIRAANWSMRADAGEALRALLPLVEENGRSDWIARVQDVKQQYPFPPAAGEDVLKPYSLIRFLGEQLPPQAIIATDVGQHQMWAAQAYPFRRPRTLLTSGGLGTMGFGLPAAIGAALTQPDTPVVCITGDGSLLMNVQELATLAEQRLNVKLVLMNNRHLGLVRQQQELFYGKNFFAVRFEVEPDFPALARAFGIQAVDLEGSRAPAADLEAALHSEGPCLIHCPVHHQENVWPMVPPGAANHEMIGGEVHVATQ